MNNKINLEVDLGFGRKLKIEADAEGRVTIEGAKVVDVAYHFHAIKEDTYHHHTTPNETLWTRVECSPFIRGVECYIVRELNKDGKNWWDDSSYPRLRVFTSVLQGPLNEVALVAIASGGDKPEGQQEAMRYVLGTKSLLDA